MDSGIPFVKYTSCGNNFVIVDETKGRVLSEDEISKFAYYATNVSFGIGCDNLLVIQRCSDATLRAIAAERDYWDLLPDESQAQFIFRMFEPSGEEALCCGNGLICIADYLHKFHRIENANILTEIPFPAPRVVTIGSASVTTDCCVNLGHPRRTPARVARPGIGTPYNDAIDFIERLEIEFRATDLKPYVDATSLSFSSYLVFTGEPHLVVFPDKDLSARELADSILGPSVPGDVETSQVQNRMNFGSWLVQRIGSYLNTRCRDMFPAGINVNFARPVGSSIVEYRCFERGLNRETLACGTGAVAVACVTKELYELPTDTIDVLPHRCRWHTPDARIQVQNTKSGWLLNTTPTMLFEGSYGAFPRSIEAADVADGRSVYVDQCIPMSETSRPETSTGKSAAATIQ